MIAGRPISFIANVGYETWPAERVVESLTARGYDSVEWTLDHLGSLLAPASALAAQADFVSRGEDAVKETLAAIEAAAEAAIGVVNVVTGPNLWEAGAVPLYDDKAWSAALSGLEQAVRRGNQVGVKIGFEPCWGTLAPDAERAERVLAEVDVSVTFDPSHFVMTGDDIPSLIRAWGDRLVHFHLKDAFGRPGEEGVDFIFCLLGEGKVPWPEVFVALDEVGYRGALSVEFEAYTYLEQVLGGDPERAAALAMEQVRALAEKAAAGEPGVSR